MKNQNQSEHTFVPPTQAAKKAFLTYIPAGIWCAATIWSSITLALNTNADPIYIVLGAIASIGAIITTIKVYKK